MQDFFVLLPCVLPLLTQFIPLPSSFRIRHYAKREGLTLISSTNLIAFPVTTFFHLLQNRISKNAVIYKLSVNHV